MARIEGAISDTRILPNGDRLDVLPMLGGKGRLTLTLASTPMPEYQYDNCWCYERADRALEEHATWDGTGDPTGWIRNPPTGRRRPNGDPAGEYVNP